MAHFFCRGPVTVVGEAEKMARIERRALIGWLEPEVADLGYELLDIEWHRGRGATLRLYIDAPRGIGLDDCERVSRAVEALLDVEDPLPDGYRLEVSSPGPERPLRTAAHFAAVQGEEIRLLVNDAGAARKLRGRVAAVEDGTLRLAADGGEEPIEIALDDIVAARLMTGNDGVGLEAPTHEVKRT
ncbi:MAG: ribosome maturation factor RimP [Gammaproteobacteria bacterium]